MAIMVVCGVVLAAGLLAGVRWSTRPFEAPPAAVDLGVVDVLRRYVWYVSIAMLAGVGAGVSVIGAGGRLAMRLLAVTAGEAAQGRTTEADEIVGRITVEGTIGFVVFTGILGGVAGAAVYLAVRRFLPAGRAGGVAYGLALLAVFGATLDPLRQENPDFDIVGPGWLSVLVFTALAVGFGLAVAGIAGRLSAWLPLPLGERRVLVRYAPVAVVAAVLFAVTAIAAVVGAVVVLVSRSRPLMSAVRSRRWVVAGRVLTVLVVLVSLPALVTSALDIAGR
jgi:hypothetical protein